VGLSSIAKRKALTGSAVKGLIWFMQQSSDWLGRSSPTGPVSWDIKPLAL